MRLSCFSFQLRSARPTCPCLFWRLFLIWALLPLARPDAQTLATHNIERVGEIKDSSIQQPTDIVMRGAWAWLAALNSFWAVDLSDPAHPQLAGQCPMDGQGRNIALTPDGKRAWVLTGATGLTGIDLADPARPTTLTTFTLPDASQSRELALKGDIAFIQADGAKQSTRLLVYNLANPAHPTLLYNSEALGALSWLTIGGDLLYAIYSVESSPSKVLIFDISDPARPRQRGSYVGKVPYSTSHWYHPRALVAGKDTLYLLDDLLNICIPDGPTGLQVLGQQWNNQNYSSYHGSLRVAQDRLGLNTYDEFRLIDCHNPAAPREIGTYNSHNSVSSAMDGDLIARMGDYIDKTPGLHLEVLRYRPTEMIQVVSPAGNDVIPVGEPIPVHWQSSPTTAGASVRIELWNIPYSGGDLPMMADLGTYSGTGGAGATEVTLPYKYQGRFRIRVVNAADPAIYGESLEPFYIAPYYGDSTIYPGFVTPSGPCVWPAGSTQQVTWAFDPLLPYYDTVSFELWRGPVKMASLGTGTSVNGSGSLTWNVPSNLPPGPGYRLVYLIKSSSYGIPTTSDITIANDQYAPWNAIPGANWSLYE